MPVTIRKRSWEAHVTHRSAPRYSYDDLDLVCCPGVRKDGPRSRRGRRERCASMPECCHPGVATFATEDRRPQGLEGEAGEKESSETSLADVFESGSVQNDDIFADQSQRSGYSLAPPTAASATELDGDGGKASPNQPNTLAKNPTASETAADAPLDPPNDNNIRSHRDDLQRPEVADSDCPVAQYPNDLTDSDTKTSLARHPDVMDSPKAPANPAQTTVAADRADAAQKEDSTAATLDPHATSTAWENAPAPLSCRVHLNGFEESSVLKADMLNRVPSIELATGESVPDHKPDAVRQGHMTGEAECCERPGKGQTDLGRPDADISGMDVTQEARGPEGLALATAHEVRGSSAQAAQTSGAGKSEGSPSAQKLADCEHLKTHLEAFGGEPCETAMREGASSESPESLSVDVECSGTTGASQERRHEGACGGSKLDTILEVSLSETGDEIGGAERQDKEDSKATVQLLSPTPKETGESPGPAGGVGVEPPSSNNMALDQGPEGHQSNKSLTSTCSAQLVLCEAEDFSSKMAAIEEEEGLDAGRCHPTLPTSSEPTEQQEPRSEENTVKLRVRKSSREERERSRLDSMVLLIMKLDQLDQEIESALCSTSSMVSTPTLRRKGISEMDLGSLSEAGSVSASTQSLHSPLHRLSSSSSSTGPAGPTGAKPKSGILAVVSEKDKAGKCG
ncbi:uncharacterized protein LOC116218500 [Clupea harengus]|uniref:Uncharacterized protein LOC116218500 n=1 Tax=Clupea harengus TaxID=7950 RepID=A0A6P8EWP3_CLUHA|nr:uncharacterized protein LOC116218500 [Clupea harengus]